MRFGELGSLREHIEQIVLGLFVCEMAADLPLNESVDVE
jgi:hypothetical protein